jgi:hypothetical protein
MARPKGKLFALLAVFAAIGLVAASGAFTSVDAERTAEVNVSGDSSALLAITDGPDNSEYLNTNGDEVILDIAAGSQGGSSELNLNALTVIDGVMTVTNNGPNEITLDVSLSGDNPSLVSILEGGTENDLTDSGTSVTIGSGNSVNLDVEIDTKGASLSSGDEIIDQITFEANDNTA